MSTIVQSPGAAVYTQVAGALSTTSQVAIFTTAPGQPGAGGQLAINLPGTARFNGKPFKVIASGITAFGAGTYTASVQPLVYAATTNGFTAAVTNAIYSSAAVNTVAGADGTTVKYHKWTAIITMTGWDTSGQTGGTYTGYNTNGASVTAAVALTKIDNPPTSVDFDAEPPLQFSVGVTTVGALSTNASTTHQLTDFRIVEI